MIQRCSNLWNRFPPGKGQKGIIPSYLEIGCVRVDTAWGSRAIDNGEESGVRLRPASVPPSWCSGRQMHVRANAASQSNCQTMRGQIGYAGINLDRFFGPEKTAREIRGAF